MKRVLVVAAFALLVVDAGCVRGCPSSRPPIHINPNMDWQPRYDAQEESRFFYDGAVMRPPVPGTVARGQLHEDTAFQTGKDESGQFLAKLPGDAEALLPRGEARYAIYCQPCHNRRGNGQGILTQRAGVPVPSFHDDRIRQLPDGEIFDVITNGKGLMPSYAYPIPVADRWAIIAHVRRLEHDTQARELALAGGAPGTTP